MAELEHDTKTADGLSLVRNQFRSTDPRPGLKIEVFKDGVPPEAAFPPSESAHATNSSRAEALSDPALNWNRGARGAHVAELQSYLKTIERVLEFNSDNLGVSSKLPDVKVNGVVDEATLNALKIFKTQLGSRFGVNSQGEELDLATLNAVTRFTPDAKAFDLYLRETRSATSGERKGHAQTIDSMLAGRDVLVPGEKSSQFRAIREQIDSRLREHAELLEERKSKGGLSAADAKALKLINSLPNVVTEDRYTRPYEQFVKLFQRLEGLRDDGKIGKDTLGHAFRTSESDSRLRVLEQAADPKLAAIKELHDRLGLLKTADDPRIYSTDVELSKNEIRFGVTPTKVSRQGDLGYVGFSYDRTRGRFAIGPKDGGMPIVERNISRIVEATRNGVDWSKETTMQPLGVFRDKDGSQKLIHITTGITTSEDPQPNARWYRVRVGTPEELLRGEFHETEVRSASARKNGDTTLQTERYTIRVPLDPTKASTFTVNGAPVAFFISPEKQTEAGIKLSVD